MLSDKCKISEKKSHFYPSGHDNESYNLIGGPDFPISDHGHSSACMSFFCESFFVLKVGKNK